MATIGTGPKSSRRKEKNIFVRIFTNKNVLLSLFLTAFLLIIFHIGSIIPLPGIKIKAGAANASDFTSMLNLLAGGGLSRMSLFAVGVGPYITAQIITQLLSSDLIPSMSRMAKAGERGKKQLEIITRVLTLPFCVAQSYAIIALLLNSNGGDSGNITIFGQTSLSDLNFKEIITLVVIFACGTYISIFFGDMITKRGIGNGVTLLILSGIVGSLFSNFNVAYESIKSKFNIDDTAHLISLILSLIVYFLFFIVLLLGVIFINDSVRKIPVQQTGQGLVTDVKDLPYLPIKLNSAGVIPVIFSSSIMTIPGTIAQFLSSSNSAGWFINNYLMIEKPVGLSLYILFIILFSFFYSYIQINPQQLSENFEKSGKFIPGVRTGMDTEKHITKVLNRVNWIGAPFLALVAALPYFISMITGIPSGLALGGTGIIIIVTGTVEFWNSIKSNVTTSGYNINKTKIESKLYEAIDKGSDDTDYQLW